MRDISTTLVITSGVMASIAFVSAVILIIVHFVSGPEAVNEVIRMMLLY